MERISEWSCLGLACTLLLLAGCAGKKTTVDVGDQFPIADDVDPCAARPGQIVTITGSRLNEINPFAKVTLNGATIVPDSASFTEVTFTVPAGATSGPVSYTTLTGTTASFPFIVTTGDVVNEVEPNDVTSGANATPMNGEVIAIGELASAFDKDHFYFTCLSKKHRQRISLAPRLVSVIYLDGLSVPLDVDGSYITSVPTGNILVGLTGAAGTYNITISQLP